MNDQSHFCAIFIGRGEEILARRIIFFGDEDDNNPANVENPGNEEIEVPVIENPDNLHGENQNEIGENPEIENPDNLHGENQNEIGENPEIGNDVLSGQNMGNLPDQNGVAGNPAPQNHAPDVDMDFAALLIRNAQGKIAKKCLIFDISKICRIRAKLPAGDGS